MSLRSVPGFKHYKADPSGLQAIGTSAGARAACMAAASALAARAAALDPRLSYSVVPADVRSGNNNELRAGAAVVQDPVEFSPKDKYKAQRDPFGRPLLTAASQSAVSPSGGSSA